MNCKVLRENSVLEVIVSVSINSGFQTIESQLFTINNTHQFQAKHISYYTSNGYQANKYQNILLIRVQKLDENDEATYRVKLSCSDLDVAGSIFYSDNNHWTVVNENNKSTNYEFKLTLHVESLVKVSFSVLYEDELLTDFKLKAQDGEISIHRTLLAAASAHFRSVLIKNSSESSLEIPKTTVKALEDFKKCIYKDILPDDDLDELLLLATYFKIHWMEYKCIDKMLSTMSSGGAINVFEFVLKHKHMPLFLGIMDEVQCGNLKMSMVRKHYLQQY